MECIKGIFNNFLGSIKFMCNFRLYIKLLLYQILGAYNLLKNVLYVISSRVYFNLF